MAKPYTLRDKTLEQFVLVPIQAEAVRETPGLSGGPDAAAERAARACLSNHISKNEGVVGVIGAEVYRRDIRLLKGLKPGVIEGGGGVKWKPALRGVIRELSSRSRLRLLHTVKNTDVLFQSMLTGTYPAEFPLDGREVKRHLELLVKALLYRFGGNFEYLWFLEFQKRGAPHLHFLLNCKVRAGDRPWLSSTWFKIVKSGDFKHLRAGTNFENLRNVDGAERYVAKYTCKTYQKMVPLEFSNVGRFWGHSSGVKPVLLAKVTTTAEQVVERLGLDVSAFVGVSGKFRNYIWDSSEKFLANEN